MLLGTVLVLLLFGGAGAASAHAAVATRIQNEGRTFVRRSTTRQETGIHEQLAWAIAEAARLGVRLDANREALGVKR